jgi:hypothetical protein
MLPTIVDALVPQRSEECGLFAREVHAPAMRIFMTAVGLGLAFFYARSFVFP